MLKSRRLAGRSGVAPGRRGGLRAALRSDLRIYSLRIRRLVDAREPATLPDRVAFGGSASFCSRCEWRNWCEFV